MSDEDGEEARPVLRAGDVIRLTTAASVQFMKPIVVRVIRELPDRHTYDGWLWLDAYELGKKGEAVARRELFVMRAGVQVQVQAPRSSGDARSLAPIRPVKTVEVV
ncbi:hypothetical protein [Micromonospora sp. M61]|uniref:hypothetical protein n=1 Tax=Micromonospora TaxID=1873 RepID=UPI001B3613BD|nr:hypothetical protein [Micromonospora sp. M61]